MNDDPRSDGPHIDDTARRVQDAVTAHGRSVQPDEAGSLPVIRQRVASARRRRLAGATALGAAAALVIGVAIGVAAGGDDTTTVAVGDGGSTTTTGPCPPSTPSSSTTTTTAPSTASIPTTSTAPTDSAAAGGSSTTIVPANAPLTAVPETTIPAPGQSDEELTEDRAEENCAGPTTGTVATTGTTTTTAAPSPPDDLVVFPINGLVPPDSATWPWPDPEATARGFLEAIGVADPALGPFESTGPDVGRILLHARDEGGTVRTDLERSALELGKVDGHWVVLAATSSSIVIDGLGIEGRESGSKVVVVTGRGRGFEGTLHVRAIGHGDVVFDRSAVVTASGGEELLPFRAELDMAGSSGQAATIVVTNDSGLDGSPVDVAAYAFRLP